MIFTQANEKTALNFLAQNDWKLEVATDKFFQHPELYVPNIKGALDKRKLEQLYNRYRGALLTYQCGVLLHHLPNLLVIWNNIFFLLFP